MKTRDKIKITSRELFNTKGVKNVTLREVAKTLEISYGNVTYHFKTKQQLIVELYEDMLTETNAIIMSLDPNNMFLSILNAPKITFSISMKYLFFYVDYVEVRRGYPDLFSRVEQDNSSRKKGYLNVLKLLQTQGVLRAELIEQDLDYLMDLSGAMRTFFFINLRPEEFSNSDLEDRYVNYVNQLVFPYLTAEGIEKYKQFSRA